MEEIDASSSSGDEDETFPEELDEFCTVDDGNPIIGSLSASELTIKNEPLFLIDKEASLIEYDGIGINPENSISISSTHVLLESEKDSCERVEDSDAEGSTNILPPAEPLNDCRRLQKPLEVLEEIFNQTHNPDRSTKNHLASSLGLSYIYVRDWFKNRRRKEARIVNKGKKGSEKATVGQSKDVGAITSTTSSHRRFTTKELTILERTYKRNHFPSNDVIENLTQKLGVESFDKIRNWFQNRRKKSRMIAMKKKTKSCCPKSQTAGSDEEAGVQLSNEQLEALEGIFGQCTTPDESILRYLEEDLGLTPLLIEKWFQQRMQNMNTEIEKENQTSTKSHCVKSQITSKKTGIEDKTVTDQQPSRKRRSNITKSTDEHPEEPVNESSSLSITYPGRKRLLLRCKVCDTIRQRVYDGICPLCHDFMKKYKKLRRDRRHIVVPPCSHEGEQVLNGCKGCRLHRYQQITKKQCKTSKRKTRKQPASKNTKTSSVSEQKLNSSHATNHIVRTSNCSSSQQVSSCLEDLEADSDKASNEKSFALNTSHIPGKYNMDLEKKIRITGKLNKLRLIASKLGNPKAMKTEERLELSSEIVGCVEDLLSHVIDSVPSHSASETKANEETKKEEMKGEQSCPILEKKVEVLQGVLESTVLRIMILEHKLKENSGKMETSTQTAAQMLHSMEIPSVSHYRPSPLPDWLPHLRNHSDGNINIHTSTATTNYSPVTTFQCQRCGQIRPQATYNKSMVCTYCQMFIDKQKMIFGLHTNTPNMIQKTHQLTGTTKRNYAQHSMPSSYEPPRKTPNLNHLQAGNVQSAVLAMTQSQDGNPSGSNSNQIIPTIVKEVLKPVKKGKTKKCPGLYGPIQREKWCNDCLHRRACNRF